MNHQYVSLSRNFVVKKSVSNSVLLGLEKGEVYDLSSDQEEFIHLLTGEMTFCQILAQYNTTSEINIKRIFKQMCEISAIVFTPQPIKRVIKRGEVPDNRLESVHLEASGECNMHCVHCYQSKYVKTGEKLSFPEVNKLLTDLRSLQVSRISISGGEPLMMPYLQKLLTAIEDKEMRISALFTNGLLVNQNLINTINRLRSKFSFFVSLDSLPGRTLSFRGLSSDSSRQVLERVVKSINLLVRNNVSVVVNTVVNTENLNHLDEMYELMGKLGVSSWRLGFPKMTPQFKRHSNEYNVEWKLITERCLALLVRHLKAGMPFQIQIEYLFREELFKQGLLELSDNDYVCDYEGRRTELCVKPNGDVVSCAYCTDLPIGNIRQTPIREIWYSSKARKIKGLEIGQVAECRGCELRNLCGTGCRANAFFLHGDFKNAKDDYACMAVAFFKERVIPILREYNVIG